MKKLHAFAFYALVTPAIALGSGVVFAEQSASTDVEREDQTTQRNYDDTESASGKKLQSNQKMLDQSGMQSLSYMKSAPANGMHASKLIGRDVKTIGDEDVGAVKDLIIDQNGQVVAVVIGVGGFLGMGEKDVAISWDKVMKSGTADKRELRIEQTRDALLSAPQYKKQN